MTQEGEEERAALLPLYGITKGGKCQGGYNEILKRIF